MPDELDYYIAEMKAGRLRIVLGPTTPQTWTVDYIGAKGNRGGHFLKRWYEDYTYEPYEEAIEEDEVRAIIRRFGGARIWGVDVARAAREQSREGRVGEEAP